MRHHVGRAPVFYGLALSAVPVGVKSINDPIELDSEIRS